MKQKGATGMTTTSRMATSPPKGADLNEGDTVQITGACLSAYAGAIGTVVYVGADRVEVALDGAVIPFLPAELDPADGPARA